MKTIRKCGNCKNRMFKGWDGVESCMWYEICEDENAEIKEASNCGNYEYGNPFDEDDEYVPSSTARDYGPSNPWDAPGMSVRDFI